MIKIAICDDEITMVNLIKQKLSLRLEQLGREFTISCYTESAELLNTSDDFDLLYLDIQMPEQDGMELAQKIRKRDRECIIIFVTAFDKYVFDSFEVGALDYLCKPIDDTKFCKALDRAIDRIEERSGKSLFIQTMSWCKSVRLSSIYYCEVINRKIYLHTDKGVVDYYGKIEELEKQLDYRFVRCHRSYLLNLDYLYEYADGQIQLQNGEKIPVSRLRRREFMQAMMEYMKKEGKKG